MRRSLLVSALIAAALASAAPANGKELILRASVCGPTGCRAVSGGVLLPSLSSAVEQGLSGSRPIATPPLGPFYQVRVRPASLESPLFLLPGGRVAESGMYWFRLPSWVAEHMRAATAGLAPFRPAHPRAWIGARRVPDPRAEVALLDLVAPAAGRFDMATQRQLDVRVAFDRLTPWTDGPQYPMLAYLPRSRVVLRDGLRWMTVPESLARRLAADAAPRRPAHPVAAEGASTRWHVPALAVTVGAIAGGGVLLRRRNGRGRKDGAVS